MKGPKKKLIQKAEVAVNENLRNNLAIKLIIEKPYMLYTGHG